MRLLIETLEPCNETGTANPITVTGTFSDCTGTTKMCMGVQENEKAVKYG
ncbi:MAG: hypothetical protein ACNYVW_02440 [Methanosarcinales archaeon]